MTNEELRVAVAELSGWERGPKKDIPMVSKNTCWHRKSEKASWQNNLPDFLNDLNAMHEAVNSLHIDKKVLWVKALRKIVLQDKKSQYPTYYDDFEVASASAHQRAEAFVKVMKG